MGTLGILGIFRTFNLKNIDRASTFEKNMNPIVGILWIMGTLGILRTLVMFWALEMWETIGIF